MRVKNRKIIINNPPPTKIFTLREFWEQRNIILIRRDVVALGDIFMHRMVFEDVKKLNSEFQVHFACPAVFFDVLKDHPFIDRLVDYAQVRKEDYLAYYDNNSSCVNYEDKYGIKAVMHRSDIWANHCGLTLTSHNMHITIDSNSKEKAIKKLRELNTENKPIVLFCPYSVNHTKNILDEHIRIFVQYLMEKNCFVYVMHFNTTPILEELKIPLISNISQLDVVAFVNESDYVITIDTAFYHIAGGLGKPLLGIFGYINGKIYGKHYQSEFIQKHKDNGDWDCGPCGYHFKHCPKLSPPYCSTYACIREISPEMIKDGINRTFKRWPICQEL